MQAIGRLPQRAPASTRYKTLVEASPSVPLVLRHEGLDAQAA